MDITIRSIQRQDLSAVVELIREFAEFEDLSQYCEVTEDRLARAMFDDDSVLEGLLVLDGDKAVGYALFFPNFSSFRGQRGFYLDDIYVNEAYRGKGVGEQMLKMIAQIGRDRGYERIDFLVLEWNTSAAGFYEKLGAVKDTEERHFKFTDAAFNKLAE